MSEVRNRSGSSLNLDTTVVGLQGFPISSTGPTNGQALVFDGTNWTPTNVQTTAPPPAAVGPTPPASPGEGALWFDTGSGILNVWNGSAWVPTYVDNDPYLPLVGGTLTGPLTLAGDATSALNPVTLQQLDSALASLPPSGATISGTAPANPTDGDLWWDTVSGQLFIYYTDANSSQWVVANVSPMGQPGPVGPEGPQGPVGPAPTPPFDLSGTQIPAVFFFPSKPAASQIIRIPIAIAITIANLFAGSQSSIGTNPTASAVFNVLSNGTSFGTATISTAGAVTWAGGAWALNPGDVLEMEAPTTQDSTLADVAFTILAVRA